MLTLLIMRHAKSKWDDPTLADHDRPLAKRGRVEARRVGELLAERDLAPEMILTSTAERAQATAALVAKGCGGVGVIEAHASLYGGDVAACLWTLAYLGEGPHVVMLVGHNPVLEELAACLCHQPVPLPTATVACVDLPVDAWSALDEGTLGTLRWVLRGKGEVA